MRPAQSPPKEFPALYFNVLLAALFALPLIFVQGGIWKRSYHDAKELSLCLFLGFFVVGGLLHWARFKSKESKLAIKFNAVTGCLMAIAFSTLMSTLLSEYFWEALYRYAYDILSLAAAVGMGLCFLSQVDKINKLQRPLIVFLCLLCTYLIYHLLMSQRGDRIYLELAPIGHRYYWAEFLVGCLPLLWLQREKGNWLIAQWGASALALTSLILLGRRIPLLAFMVAALLCLVIIVRHFKAKHPEEYRAIWSKAKLPTLGITIGLLLIGVLAMGMYKENSALTRIKDSQMRVAKYGWMALDPVRMPIYSRAYDMISENPAGTGRGSFPLQFFDLMKPGHHPNSIPAEVPSYQCYNLFLHWSVEAGILAGVALFALFIVILRNSYLSCLKSEGPARRQATLLWAGLCALFLCSFSFSTLEYPPTRFLLLLYLAVNWGNSRNPGTSETRTSKSFALPNWSPIAACILQVLCWFSFITYSYANYLAQSAASKTNLAEARELAARSVSLNPDQRTVVLQANIEFKDGRLNEAEQLAKNYLEKHPHDALVRQQLIFILGSKKDYKSKREQKEQLQILLNEHWPASLYGRYILGRIFQKGGQVKKGQEQFEILLQYYPEARFCPLTSYADNYWHKARKRLIELGVAVPEKKEAK